MEKDDQWDASRPWRIKTITYNISQRFDNIQRTLVGEAAQAGYARDVFRTVSDACDGLSDDPLLQHTEASLLKYEDVIRAAEQQAAALPSYHLASSAWSSASSSSSAIATIVPLSNVVRVPEPPPDWVKPREVGYSERLARLDPELAKTFNSIWSTFYGTRDDPERHAMFAMRQTFDHFFHKLAPDEEVRKSPFFKPKEPPKSNQVTRAERIQYVAHTRVSDKVQAEYLAAEADHVIEIYRKLNKLHKRGSLDREKVREVLTAMGAVLQQWIEAIEL